MTKTWRVVSAIVLVCFIVGIACIGIAFFTGSSPVVIREHGAMAEYSQRLAMNRDIFQQYIANLLANIGL